MQPNSLPGSYWAKLHQVCGMYYKLVLFHTSPDSGAPSESNAGAAASARILGRLARVEACLLRGKHDRIVPLCPRLPVLSCYEPLQCRIIHPRAPAHVQLMSNTSRAGNTWAITLNVTFVTCFNPDILRPFSGTDFPARRRALKAFANLAIARPGMFTHRPTLR